jgi:cytochrome b561
LRLLWRLGHPAPPLPPDTPGWIKVSAWLSHRLLYAFLLILPIIGWLRSSAFGAPVHFYGLFDLPALISPDKSLAHILFAIHIWGAFALAALSVSPYRGGSLSSARPPGFRLPPHGGVRQLQIPRISQLPRADLTILPAS